MSVTNWFDGSYPPSVLNPPIPPTGATAGTPGSWTPPGAQAPATLVEANGIGKTGPAWTVGQWVDLAGGGDCYWNGVAFLSGQAPAEEEPAPETTKTTTKTRRSSKAATEE